MSRSWTISRRTLLKGIGAAVALPALDAMTVGAVRAAEATASPRRIGYFYFPNGIPRGIWYPEEVAEDGTLKKLNEWMSPLEPFKSDIIIPTNIWTPLGNGHGSGTATWLTGQNYNRRKVTSSSVSIDQLVARHTGRETLLPSLEMSTKGEGYFSNSLPRNAISWDKNGRPMAREIEPRVIFDRMFSSPGGGITNRTVMDSVLAEARTLLNYVSASDKHRLNEYFESINALEKRIAFAENQTRELSSDGALTPSLIAPQPGIPSDHQEYVRLMLDLIVLAFQTDATRVATFMLDHGQSNRYFNFIDDVRGTWHALSHYGNASGKTEDDDGTTSWDSVAQKRAMFAEVVRWHHHQMAYLFERMKAIREPDGRTLLENSMLVYGSSLGDGDEHDAEHLPTIVAGGGGGTIKTGRKIEFEEPTDLASIHLAFAQRAGVDVSEFGTADEPLTELAG